MRRLLCVIVLEILFSSMSSYAENICHQKPPGECENCCQKSNETNFKEAIEKSCARLKGTQGHEKTAIESEVIGYAAVNARDKAQIDVYLFRSYLDEYCVANTGKLNFAALEMSYADCANGCPKPKKESSKKKKEK